MIRGCDEFISAAGLRMRVRRLGVGQPGRTVAVLHGFTGSIESMQPVSEAFAADRPVVALDLVGHGETEAPARPSAYSMEACVAQIVAVFDALGLGCVHVVGYSMGARAALSLAAAHPTRIASLVLVGVSPGLPNPEARAERVAADEALARKIEMHGLERFVDDWMALPLFASQAACGEAFLAASRAQRLRSNPLGLAESLRGMGSGAMPPLHDRLKKIAQPVLLIAGSRDEKFTRLATELRGLFPAGRSLILEGVGHAAHLEATHEFARLTHTFLLENDHPQEIQP